MRTLSQAAVTAIRDQVTPQVFLFLLEFRHNEFDQPVYLVNNTESIVSNGRTYQPFPFSIVLGEDNDTNLPIVNLTIDNVSKLLVDALRAATMPPEITLRLVMASAPDIVEIEISGLVLRSVTIDAQTISGNLVNDAILETRYPADNISPAAGYYGLFRT